MPPQKTSAGSPNHEHQPTSSVSPLERIPMIRTLFFFWLLTSVCWSSATAAENHWPRFRGPNADGVAPDHRGLPTTWTTTQNVKWVADVPGWGWSCPVVWGDRVFLTAVVADQQTRVPQQGVIPGRRRSRAGARHSSLDGLLLRSEHGPGAVEARSPHGSAAGSPTPQEHLCIGNADDRRQPAVCPVRRPGSVVLRSRRPVALAAEDRTEKDRIRLWRRFFARGP
jgi:hypothetical protein